MNQSPDKALHRLHQLGWSVGDVGFLDLETGRTVWLVTGTRGGHTISAKASTQLGARREACRLAAELASES